MCLFSHFHYLRYFICCSALTLKIILSVFLYPAHVSANNRKSQPVFNKMVDFCVCYVHEKSVCMKTICLVCSTICPMNYAPVCGSNGKTYGNLCQLNADACRNPRQNIKLKHNGACKTKSKLDKIYNDIFSSCILPTFGPVTENHSPCSRKLLTFVYVMCTRNPSG